MFSAAWAARLGICILLTILVLAAYIAAHFTITNDHDWLSIKPVLDGAKVSINFQMALGLAINTFLATANFAAILDLLFGRLNKLEQINHIRGNLAVGLLVVFLVTSLTALSIVFEFEVQMGF